MKIAILSKDYPPYGNTSEALFNRDLALALVQRGHTVHVISQAPDGKAKIAEDKGIILHQVGPKPRTGSALKRALFNFNSWGELNKLAKHGEIEVVHSSTSWGDAFLYSMWKKTPLILFVHALSDMFISTNSYSGLKGLVYLKVISLLESISLRRADKVITHSPNTYRYIIGRKRTLEERVALIWNNRIDLNKFKFSPSDIRDRLAIPDSANMVLYVGWLEPRKGLQILIQALPNILAHFPDTVFVLLGRDTYTAPGGGSFKQYLVKYAKEHSIISNLKIIEEFLSEEDLVKFYSACDLFVLPSLWETFGLPVIEAMACQRPIVATATGSMPEFKGLSPVLLVVPPGDLQALSKAIIKVLSTPKEEREHLAIFHRRIVEELFSFDRMVDEIINIYEEVIKRGKQKGSS